MERIFIEGIIMGLARGMTGEHIVPCPHFEEQETEGSRESLKVVKPGFW